jgi:hypothetical protein
MQRLIMYVLGLGVVVLVVVIAAKSMATHAPLVASGGGDAGAPLTSDAASPGTSGGGEAARADAGSAVTPTDLTATDESHDLRAALALAVPPGPARQVRVGVVLVQYDGAQGAGPKARSKRDALTIAQKLADEARSDFRAAVQHGDSGSSDDIGHIQRGVLDGPVESALFALPVGGVSDVIDTPRGFWIAKRLE